MKPFLSSSSSAAARRVLLACSAKQDTIYTLHHLVTRKKQSNASKSLEDITPPYLSNQIKYSSDSYLERDFHEDDDYERYSQMIPRNITKHAAAMTSTRDEVAYDEDYDQFNSHMTPSSMQRQDYEELDSLEMIQHEDVEPSEELRVNADTAKMTLIDSADVKLASYNFDMLEDVEYVELEEDWEIMQERVQEGKSTPCEIYDNIDDVNDVVE